VAERNVVDAPITPAPEKASLFEDFIDIFVSPSKVFARRANSGFLLVTLIVSVITAVLLFAGRSTMDSLIETQMLQQQAAMAEQNPQLTEEQAAMGRRIGMTAFKVTMYIATPLLVLLLGLLVWLVSRVFGVAFGYGAAAMIVAYSLVPRLLQSVAFLVQGMFMDPATAGFTGFSFGPARFMDPATTSAGILGLLGRFDLFIIWGTILIGIGISVVGRVPRAKGYTIAAVIWVLGAVPALLGFANS
jgi:hypothetical protein